ncbi:MAG TPA: lipopolysaccharide heptosyltransferase II [Thiothrix sp.]|nr:lipopolysaccharide heptosyltransferase II [Thiothrix sp.]
MTETSPTPQRYLIVGPSWVGDMMMAQSLFIRLKQQSPEADIDVLAPAWSIPLLECMPEVRQGIIMPLGHGKLGLRERYQLGKQLREATYDTAIVLPNSWKSALVPFFANIPRRIGYRGEMRYGLLNDLHQLDKQRLSMTVQRFVALAEKKDSTQPPHYAYPHLTVSDEEKAALKHALKLSNAPLLVLCAGAEYGEAKRWSAQSYANVAKTVLDHGWQVCLAGSTKDAPITQAIAAQVNHPQCYDLAGKTSLKEVTVLLALATQVISNDSGLMHIAAAVNTPVIAIYGSSDPTFTPPLNQRADIIYLDLACSPCFKRECPLQHLDCLNQIKPQQVINKLAL